MKNKTGFELIAAERVRQIAELGFTPENDSVYDEGELAQAAACYLDTAVIQLREGITTLPPCYVHKDWPWRKEWWKPSNDPIRNLVRAGALTAAAIDREGWEDRDGGPLYRNQLIWERHEEEREIRGFLQGERDVPLFIVREEGKQCRLLGAFIPTQREREMLYAEFDRAQIAAESYLAQWLVRRSGMLAWAMGRATA